MIILIFAIIGAVTGALLARKNGGTRLDMLQYAASLAIAAAIVGLFASIFLARSL